MGPIRSISLGPTASDEMSFSKIHTFSHVSHYNSKKIYKERNVKKIFVRMIFGLNCLAKNCGASFLQRMHFIDSNTIQLFSPHAQYLKDLDLFNIQHSPMIFHSSIKFQNMLEISPTEIKTFLLLGYLLKQKTPQISELLRSIILL